MKRRFLLATVAAAAAAVSIAAVAVAAHPIKRATYSGSFVPANASTPISFKVSANGKRVSSFAIGVPPVGCQGGGFGNPKPGSAAVSTKAHLHRDPDALLRATAKRQRQGRT